MAKKDPTSPRAGGTGKTGTRTAGVNYRAQQIPGAVVIFAEGWHPTSGWVDYFEQSPLEIYPPQFILRQIPPTGPVTQVLTPFVIWVMFGAHEPVEAVTVADADGEHEMKVEQTPDIAVTHTQETWVYGSVVSSENRGQGFVTAEATLARATTMATGEEGGGPTTMATGEEDVNAPTTMATGEEGGGPTTMATGEETANIATTLAVGEEEGSLTTLMVGEENPPTTLRVGEEEPTTFMRGEESPTTLMVGEENPPTTLRFGEENPPTTLRIGEEGGTTFIRGEEDPTTLMLGEEDPTTRRLGEEGPSTDALGEEGPTTFMLGEEEAGTGGPSGGNPFGGF